MKEIVTSKSAPTIGFTDPKKAPPIVQAIRWDKMFFVSGQGPLDPATKTVIDGDIGAQTRQTLTNLLNVLKEVNATFANVVNMRVTLRNVADFPKFNEAFGEMLAGEKVTRTCVGGTPHRTGVNVEIDCIAMLG